MSPSCENWEQHPQDQLPLLRAQLKLSRTRLEEISQDQRARLSHIDFKLHFLGSVNATDLVSCFGIKEAAASRDLSFYKDHTLKSIEYDTKTYIQRQSPRGSEQEYFTPLFLRR